MFGTVVFPSFPGVTIWKPQETQCPQSVTLRSAAFRGLGSQRKNYGIPSVFNSLALPQLVKKWRLKCFPSK